MVFMGPSSQELGAICVPGVSVKRTTPAHGAQPSLQGPDVPPMRAIGGARSSHVPPLVSQLVRKVLAWRPLRSELGTDRGIPLVNWPLGRRLECLHRVVLTLWGTMVIQERFRVPVGVAVVVVVATRGVFRRCEEGDERVFRRQPGGTTVRQHATLPTAVGFAILPSWPSWALTQPLA